MFANPKHAPQKQHQTCATTTFHLYVFNVSEMHTLHIQHLIYIKNAHHINIRCVRAMSYRENMMLTTQYKTMNAPVYKNMRNKNGATCKITHPKIK